MLHAIIAVDWILTAALVWQLVKHIAWLFPRDGEARIRNTEFVVRYMADNRHWYMPVLIGICGAASTVFTNFNLIAAPITLIIDAFVLVGIHYWMWRKYRLPSGKV